MFVQFNHNSINAPNPTLGILKNFYFGSFDIDFQEINRFECHLIHYGINRRPFTVMFCSIVSSPVSRVLETMAS